jgi:hypothetical protein
MPFGAASRYAIVRWRGRALDWVKAIAPTYVRFATEFLKIAAAQTDPEPHFASSKSLL